MSFWVYENTVHKKARIHRADCPYCADGRGIHGGGRTASGNWHGPFAELDTAEKIAKGTGQPDIRGCDLCVAGEASLVADAKPIKNNSDPPNELIEQFHAWDSELSHTCSLRLSWIPIGKIILDEVGKLRFPKTENSPGLYRLRTRNPEGRSALYIGESDDLSRRFGNYRNPGPTQETSLRINRFLVELLSSGGEVSIGLAKNATLETLNGRAVADLTNKNVRRMLECLAIVMEHAADIEKLNR